MINAIDLLIVEIERMRKLSVKMHQQGLAERGEYRQLEADRLQKILDILEAEYYNKQFKKNEGKKRKFTTKVLAKKVRHIRVLLEVMEKWRKPPYSPYYKNKAKELKALKKILGLIIKKELDKS